MDRRKSLAVVQIVFNLLIVVALILFSIHSEQIYILNYLVDVGCILVVFLLYTVYLFRRGFDLFDPLGIITFIYGFMYFVTPVYDIVIGKYTWFGYNLFPYGVKSSLIALVGYIAFYLFYTVDAINKGRQSKSDDKSKAPRNCSKAANSMILSVVLAFYTAAFMANVYYLIHSGYGNLLYILTMGILGSGNSGMAHQEAIGFVAMFSYCLPTLVLLYWEYGGKKLVTTLLFIPVLMMQVTRGFRFLIVQIVISFVSYYYITRKKRPKLQQVVWLFLLLMVPILLMTMFRNDVRSGIGISFSGFSGAAIRKALDDAIWDNFRIYNNFYGLVHAVPNEFGYIFLRQILIGSLVMTIPRAIWPNKISTQAGVGLETIIGSRLAKTGQAYPGLGEYYYSFGIPGVLFFMAVYGVWMRCVRDRYMSPKASGLDIITFSILLGANIQIIIRGYTPSNFWYLVFSLLPVIVVRYIEKSLNVN